MEPLKSIEEAADIWGVSPWTVRAYVRQGKIRPVRIGRRVLIEAQEIQRLIDEGRGTEPKAGKSHQSLAVLNH
jgi:excisionase family DNA binding protein